jgi:site-specific DNA recombinase
MKAVLYTRVSTDEQANQGVSLAVQEERLRAYCVARDWQVVAVYADAGASGKTLDRPALGRLLEDLQRGDRPDVLVVFKLDRLTRRVRDLGWLLERLGKLGVQLASLAESLDASTATGRLLINLLGSVAQWEREAIAERTSAALQYKRRQLRVYGQVPYGFDRDGDRLVPNAAELAIVKEIYDRRHRGGQSLQAIARELNAQGVRTKRWGRWHAEQVRLILGNTIYQPYVEGGEGNG